MADFQKVIKQAADILGLKYDRKRVVAYGAYQGYTVMITPGAGTSRATTMQISLGAKLGNEPVEEMVIRECGLPEGVSRVGAGYGIDMLLANKGKRKDLVNKVTDTVIRVTEGLKAAGCEPCDEKGVSGETAVYFVRGRYAILAEDTLREQLYGAQRDKAQEDQTQEQLIPGIIGALIGSLVGVALILLLGRLGRVSMLSGLVMGIGVVYGYKKLGKKFSRLSCILCIVISVVMSYLAFRVDTALDLYSGYRSYVEEVNAELEKVQEEYGLTLEDLKEYGFDPEEYGLNWSYMDILLRSRELFAEDGSLGTYYVNLFLMMLTGAGGSIASIWAERANQKESFEVKKLED